MIFTISKRPTIKEIHELYKTERASCLGVTKFFLNRSQEVDKKLNAVNKLSGEFAEKQAQECDKILDKYKAEHSQHFFESLVDDYPIFGIPFFVKAIILVEGDTLNASSKILDEFKSPYSSTAYDKCQKAGAILLGIANMDEFATGASGETNAFGPTKNPFDITRVPGGSSSGPAVVVASGQCVFSLGTDTGGSIRQPAAFTNTVGLKPTYGLVSRFGVMPMASSFDQVGPITNSVEDNAILTKILAGKDENDQTSLDSSDLDSRLRKTIEKFSKETDSSSKKLKIGLPKEFFIDGVDSQVSQKIEEVKTKLIESGHEIMDISLPLVKHALSVYYLIMPVELAANLERYDGIRYALQDQDPQKKLYFNQRENFGDEVKRRIMLGTYASSAGYYDAYYNQAQKVRQLAKQDFDKAFTEVDVLLTPVTPEFPFKFGSKTEDPLSMYLSDVFTCGINPVRIPGLSVPLGLFPVEDQGKKVNLPTGIQILGPELSENLLFQLGQEIENIVAQS